MFGIAIKKVKFSKKYTNEELIAEMSKQDWGEAGTPSIVKHGFSEFIVFPPIDRQNQVWITLMSAKGSDKAQIMLSHDIAGDFGNMASNMILDHLTDGISSIGSAFGKKAKKGESDVELVTAKLTAMNL